MDDLDKIEQHREQIDIIDAQLIDILNIRAQHSLAIRAIKPHVGMNLYDPRREEQILTRLTRLNNGPLFDDGIREIFSTILKVMKETPHE